MHCCSIEMYIFMIGEKFRNVWLLITYHLFISSSRFLHSIAAHSDKVLCMDWSLQDVSAVFMMLTCIYYYICCRYLLVEVLIIHWERTQYLCRMYNFWLYSQWQIYRGLWDQNPLRKQEKSWNFIGRYIKVRIFQSLCHAPFS